MAAHDLIHKITARITPVLGVLAPSYAERILLSLFRCSRADLYLERNLDAGPTELAAVDGIVNRLLNDEPLDYILGTAYFYNREFEVNPSVLLPRPDTETLVGAVLDSEKSGSLLLADMGTGSGIIACILAEERPRWRAVAIDISPAALSVARRNLRSSGIALLCADFFSPVKTEVRFDVIVSNPPYIPSAEIERLDRSVRMFEPHGALDGGRDGLDFYRRLADSAPAVLKPGGRLYCEIGYDQKESVMKLFSEREWTGARCMRDLAGHSRVISVYLRGGSNQ